MFRKQLLRKWRPSVANKTKSKALLEKMWRIKWWLLSIFTVLFLLFALFFPLNNYYVELPGGAFDTKEVLTVNKKADDSKGSYNFVAVAQTKATLALMLYAQFNDFAKLQTAEEATGNYSDEDFMRINQFYMETSQNQAVYQGLTLAGKEVSLEYMGVYVLQVADDSSFKGVLNIADTVTAVNGNTFDNSTDMIKYVQGLKLGSKVKVTYMRDGKEKTATGKIIKIANGKNGIGIGLTDHTEIKSPENVKFKLDGVGGPSAGLMFTLAIYDQVSGQDLKAGRKIAGTGTIEKDGAVGDIGGAYLKVKSAADSGADIFFVPNNLVTKEMKKADPDAKTNYQEAKEAAEKLGTKMKIVPVKTAQEAIDYFYKKAQEYDLLVTCGSDYHGKTKPSIHLGDSKCSIDQSLIEEQLKNNGLL